MRKILGLTTSLLLSFQFASADTFSATTFELRTTVQNKCLDVSGYSGKKGQNVQIYNCDGHQDQRWYFYDPRTKTPITYGTFLKYGMSLIEIRNAKTGLCLDIQGYDGEKNDTAMIWNCGDGLDQTWAVWSSWERVAPVAPLAGSVFRLRNMLQQPRYNRPYTCLDVAGTSGASGNNVQLWDCDDFPNEDDMFWKIENVYSEVLTH
jgi:hypothetical protein